MPKVKRYDEKTRSGNLSQMKVAAVLSILILSLNCCISGEMPRNIRGSLFIFGAEIYAFNPATGLATIIHKPGKRFRPTFQCKIAQDTMIVMSQNPLKHSDGFSGYFQVVPFENEVKRIDELGDFVSLTKRIDYNEHLRLFLFYGKLNSDELGLYLLDDEFNVVRDISNVIQSFKSPGSVNNFYLLDSITILFNHTYQEVYKYSLVDSSSKKIANGKLKAISHDRRLAVLSVGYSGNKVNHLLNLVDYSFIELPPIEPANFCFSPDDSFIACQNVANDLSNTVELYIFEIRTRKLFKTSFTGSGTMVWVNTEN